MSSIRQPDPVAAGTRDEVFVFPASYAQRRIWLRYRRSAAAWTVEAFRLVGRLEPSAFRRAVSALVARHESLRTTFAELERSLVQVVAPGARVGLPVVDLAGLDGEVLRRALRGLARAEAERGFDLERGPLVRLTLLRLGPEEHVALCALHRMVGDGASLGIVARELASVYAEGRAGWPPALPELPVQYADYAESQREWIEGGGSGEREAYWRRRLGGACPVELPTDRPRGEGSGRRRSGRHFHVDRERAEALRRLAHERGATVFGALLTVFQTLLQRYGAVDDVVVATEAAGREAAETEGVIGPFAEPVVLRGDLSGRPGLREALDRTSRRVSEDLAHARVPLERQVTGWEGLVRAGFAFTGHPRPQARVEGLTISPLPPAVETAGAPGWELGLVVAEEGGGLAAILVYDPDLFDGATVRRLAEHLERLLAGGLRSPERPLRELTLLAPGERHQHLHEWGEGPRIGSALPEGLADLPLENLRLRVLDRGGRPVPAGARGELWVAGKAPDVPVEAGAGPGGLLPDPLSSDPGTFLYRTGLAARFGAAGSVELLDRPGEPAARATAAAPPAEPEAPVGRPARELALPASFAQERLWFLDRLAPGDPSYHLFQALRLTGRLELSTLHRALAEVAARHESLRTTFREEGERPVQVIAPSLELTLPLVDLGTLAPELRERELESLMRQEAVLPFDLARGPLVRLRVVRLGREEHTALFNLHHIVGDGWSLGVLVREVAALYGAFHEGRSSPLRPLASQYFEYADAQREALASGALEADLAYWRERLAGLDPVELPADRPRPAMRSPRGGTCRRSLTPARVAALRALARERGTTLFTVLLAGLQALLQRYSGRDDLPVGSVVAGRTRVELEALIGFFVNTLVFRGDLAGAPGFGAAVERLGRSVAEALEHQELPFERLVEELAPERDLSRTPLFDVLFVLQNTPPEALELPGLTLTPVPVEKGTAMFDWTLSAVEVGEGLEVALEYSADLFDRTTAERAVEHWVRLVEAAVAEPERPLPELPLLSPAERQQALEWSRVSQGGPRPSPEPLGERLARVVAERPDVVAVASDEGALTFAGLDRRAGVLARALERLGVEAEAPVALSVAPGPRLMVAIVGTWRAGCAYVPLDPSYPPARLAAMLEDSGAVAVVSDGSLPEGLAPDLPRIDVRTAGNDAEAPEPGGRPEPDARSLAYVLFTSGSTGRPKGVMVTRGSVATLCDALDAAVYSPGLERAGVNAPSSFDASVEQLVQVFQGRTVVVVPEDKRRDGEALLDLADRHRLDVLDCTPTQLQILLAAGLERRESPRLLVVGGEALGEPTWRRLAADRGRRTVNAYGPTECTVDATVSPVGRGVESPRIGRPLPQARVHVADPWGREVPPGLPGELLVGGAGLARGYAGRPGQTAERFVPDVLGDLPGRRLYRTGDRARFRPEGDLEFLGRLDRQVKLRGFRIELAEIEAALATHPGVRDAAAALDETAPGGPRLVAWVAAEGGMEPEKVREAAAARLPAYMVPAAVTVLDRMPRTPGGKLDRAALAAPEGPTGAGDPLGLGRPRTPVEELLAGLWAQVLGAPRVGIHDGFFELGGHSLLATQLVSRVRRAFGVELPVRSLFEAPTVARLAGVVERARAGARGPEAGTDEPPLRPVPEAERPERLPLSFSQERLWVLDRLDPGTGAYNVSVAVRLSGRLDLPALAGSLGALVDRHEALRTTFGAEEGRPYQRIGPAEGVRCPVVDLGRLGERAADEEADRRLRAEAARPFDLASGPLVRALLLRVGPGEHVLLVNMHHVVSDGWSVGVVVEELAEGYTARREGREPSLPALPLQYADFALWQRELLQGERLERRLGFWRGYLGGDAPPLELPADRPRPAIQSFRGATVPVRVPPAVSRRVERLASASASSPFMVVLSAFDAWLHRVTGSVDLRVGTFIANRTRAEIEPLVGFFVNTLVLRSRPEGEASFAGFADSVRESTLDAYAHQELPFERLLEELQPERALDHTPLFQVMFVFQNTPERLERRLPHLELEQLGVETGRSNFDLTLWLGPGEEGLEGVLQYAADLFEPTTALRFSRQLVELLSGAVTAPGRSLGDLPLLAPGERHQVLVEWNPPVPPHRAPAVEEVVARRAAEAPDRVAVVAPEGTLSYEELDLRARRVARELARLGVGADDRVAVWGTRSPETVVALVAVLRSGAGSVVLDPAEPAGRRAQALEDAPVAAWLAPAGNATAREALAGLGVPPVEVGPSGAPRPAADPAGEGTLESPGGIPAGATAYVVFTSGTTGRPKGVAVSRGSLAAFVRAAVTRYGFGPGDRVLQFASLAFDASAEEIWGALAAGATLVLRDDAMLGTAARFLERCRAERVTVLDLPTAYWHHVVAEMVSGGLALPESVRQVILGGEKAAAARWADWRERVDSSVSLVNSYGPTEATVVATAAELGAPVREPWGWREAPIGRALPGVRAHVFDARGREVPPGVPGELVLGGTALARGYLGDPARTAAGFVPDPVVPPGEAGARLYRTGDRVRRRADGVIEYLGRLDRQLKVRGFRIEPGEVEAALADHPGIEEAVVDASEATGGRLAAWIVAAEDPVPAAEELRSRLAARLPEFLVPSFFVPVAALPLTPTGKVDRARLPSPEGGREALGTAYVAPRTPTEELLAGIWEEVLGGARVGVRDDFFDLGGHSLLATQVVARVESALGVELPLRAFFEAPTLETMAHRVEAAGHAEAPPLVPVSRDREIPLSFSQERIWFLAQLDPESASYHVPRAMRITGPLDLAAVGRAYFKLVERHEVLRTSFPAVDGRPVQRILPPRPVPLPVIDLEGVPAERRMEEVERLALADGVRTFDLARGPLLRASLVRLGPEEHVALQCEHHLVHDGWAEAVLIGDLLELYRAQAEGRAPELPDLPIQYADFACWQRDWLSGEVLERQLAYWREHLEGAPPVLELPADRPRPAIQRFRGDAVDVELAPDLVRGLTALGRREGATLFMVTLAAFQALLLRLSGREDLVVGTGVANRRRRETEGMLGMIINTLALRTDLAGDPAFRRLLPRVRETCLGAYAHQDLPFGKVVETLHPERSLGHAPVFQVLFAFHDAEFPDLNEPGFEVESLHYHNRSSKFDLVLIAMPRPDRGDGRPGAGGLGVHLEYDADLFDATTIERLAAGYERLLEVVAAEPEIRLSRVPLLSPGERHQVVVEWNDTASRYPREETLGRLFEAQVERTPDAVAVEGEGGLVTYRELDRRAGELAARLRGLGVGPDVLVGVRMERDPGLVTALLGIVKAGGAYVPLDPDYPEERQNFMLGDSGASVLVARDGLGGEGARVVAVTSAGRPAEGVAASADARQALAASRVRAASTLAYVIYTSGSTGRPKGVAVPHRAVARLVLETDYVRLGPDERVAQASNASFDAATFEVWGALLQGATLVTVPSDVLLAPRRLAEDVRRRRVTALFLTTSLFNQVAREEPRAYAPLRHVLFGGESGDPAAVRRVLEHGGPARLLNVYGPTECTTFATWLRLREVPPGAASVPLGRPIAATRVQVVDRRLGPAPPGVVGELALGGDGLARGYLARPGRTAASFVPDPLGAEPGGRLYRTGDLARTLPDGTLVFVGRLDHQVKLRGFRVELGEVEAALAIQPGVAAAVALAREDGPGDRRLVAYLVPEGEEGPSPEALREALEERLPAFMVPAAFVTLEALPTTPSGKLDRRALPAPEWRGTEHTAAPRTAAEEVLAGIWGDVLGVERVGVEDDFFSLGGHSLLATQVASRVREAFGVEMPLRWLFEEPTVAALARRVDEAARSGLPPVERAPRDRPLPLSFAQERLWFLDRLEPGSALYNVPFALRLLGALDPSRVAASLSGIVRRHEALRTRLVVIEGRPAQRVEEDAGTPLPMIDLSRLGGAREAEARAITFREAARPFDLARGPLVRAALVRLAHQDHLLLGTMHHAVSDGWSVGVLVRELAAFYGGESLPELPVQYPDFAAWQRAWLSGEVLERELAWWREALAGVPRVLELPADRPRPPVPSHRGGVVPVRLPAPLTAELRALARERGATLFMVLLAAFQTLLARHAHQEEVLVGSPVANRNRLETEGLVGFFVNTLVLRGSLAGDPPFRELVDRARRTTLEAYAHQDLPFERLVEALEPERDAARSPLFQAMLVLQNAPGEELRLPGLEVRYPETGTRTSKFDATLALTERDGELAGALEYATDLFDRTTVERLGGRYRRLLEAVAAAPEARASRVPLLSPEERHQVVVEWADTAETFPRDRSIPDLFDRQAALRAEAVAVRQGTRWWTYGELRARADRLAARLAEVGVGPEVTVGLVAERSPERVAGLLGILKAGGAYLPLEPGDPEEHLTFVLDDGRAPVVVVSNRLAGRLPPRFLEDRGRRIVSLEDALERGGDAPGPPPDARLGGCSLAYVLYTSGSTGRPKGVAVEHRSVVRLVKGADYLSAGPDEVFLQLAPVAFDASTLEVWGALLHGSRLEVFPPGPPTVEALGRELQESRVTTLWLTAGLFHEAVDRGLEGLAGVSQLLAGGDVLSPPHVARVLASRRPGQALINGYGPTEGTTFTACHRMEAGAAEGEAGRPVPIGRPISNTRVHLVEPGPGGDLRPVPLGVPGELCLGGEGTAREYRRRPRLTASSFVPDPFGGEPGARLYRTGDLVRWLPDGTLGFVGRLDYQVKVRGFRVEPGEIEAALVGQPGVAAAVAVAREDAPGDRRLVAYVVPEGEEAPSPEALREALKARLPAFLVPAAIVVLEAFPTTPSGKVDRRALPTPDWRGAARAVAPRTATEELLAGIWSSLLGLERVGVEDDFFALGGHSLLATRVASRVQEAFGVELPLRWLFEEPTVARLARRIDGAARGRLARLPPLEPVPRDRPLPLSFAQERLWFLDRLEPGSPLYNLPAALRLSGRLDLPLLASSVRRLVRRHEALRTVFAGDGDGARQVVRLEGGTRVALVDLGGVAGPRGSRRPGLVDELVRGEARRPFDLVAGPLVRAAVLRVSTDEHVLLLTLHHIVADGWTAEILVRELGALYRAGLDGEVAALPDLPVQYPDFAVWQRRWLRGEALERHLAHWRGCLEGAPVLRLPTDRPRPTVPTFRGATWSFDLGARVADELSALAAREGVTPYMALLGAFAVLLHRHTGQSDLVVGSDVAGRTRPELEDVAGFFVNQLALRVRLRGEWSFRELLAEVRDVVLDAHQNQDLPFERLVDELEIERDLSRNPLFQVVLALQEDAPSLGLPGVTVESLAAETGTSKVDLTLGVARGEGGLSGAFAYSTELFDRTTVGRMARHLAALLCGAFAEPDRRLGELPLLDRAERHQVLVAWNDTRRHGDGDFQARFEDRVRRSPARVAVRSPGHALSYRELRLRAGRVAAVLAGRAAAPETVVAVLDLRGADLVSALVGVLEAGAVYLPLDPYHPVERHARVLADSGAALVLAGSAFLETAREAAGLVPGLAPEVAPLAEALEGGVAKAPPARPSAGPRRDPLGLAYVLYTSGSTGAPKGAMVPRAGLLNHLLAKVSALGLGAGDAVAQTASQCFDVSLWQMLSPLLVGGCVHVAPDDVVFDGTETLSFLAREGITVFEAVPSMLRAMLEPLERGPVPEGLRWVIPTGEALAPEVARRWLEAMPGVPLLNAYGPTECSDDVTHEVIRRAPDRDAASVDIGRTLPNLRIRVVDRSGRPVPASVAGELRVSGVGVGRGYLGAPALTAEAFVPDAESEAPGERSYRTGDLAAWRADGRLSFLGRLDHQVKLRGFRIEPGEIEAALEANPAVAQAVVAVRERGASEPRLVAWVVPAEGSATASSVDDWRQVFDETYATDRYSERDAGVSLELWTSSYTGEPLPEEEIFESVEESAGRIRAFGARSILEIGCGSGLLLFRVAPECERYWGTDVSPEILARLRSRIDGSGTELPEIRLLEQAADDWSAIPEGAFDLVVLNEVVQYFPGADYLVRVLEAAARAVRPGGAVFVGGVRSFPLLEAFHASVEAHRADPRTPAAELTERIAARAAREKELAVAPELFAALARSSDRFTSAQVRLKSGRADNELASFRFDVVLGVSSAARRRSRPDRPEGPVRAVDWRAEGWSLDTLATLLADGPETVALGTVPNARTAAHAGLVELLDAADADEPLESLREEARRAAADDRAVEPEDLVAQVGELGYEAVLGWERSGRDGAFQALLVRRGGPADGDGLPFGLAAADPGGDRRWARWANNPLQGALAAILLPGLRADLRRRLPEYMVPSAMVVLEALPLTPHGKVDRRALPEPDRLRPDLEETFVAARNEQERRVAAIWAEVLGVDRVGVFDNFFALGGHSLLATQVLSRVRDAFDREVPLRDLFDRPTVSQLTELLGRDGAEGATPAPPALTKVSREAFRTTRTVLDEE